MSKKQKMIEIGDIYYEAHAELTEGDNYYHGVDYRAIKRKVSAIRITYLDTWIEFDNGQDFVFFAIPYHKSEDKAKEEAIKKAKELLKSEISYITDRQSNLSIERRAYERELDRLNNVSLKLTK